MNPKYGKPPITEAIIDLRVEPRPGASAVEIATAFSDLKDEFQPPQELSADTGIRITFGTSPSPHLGGRPVLGGFRYDSKDRSRVMQARRNGFVFSLVPTQQHSYEGWDTFSKNARILWERYRDTWKPLKIVRIALRYVNQFEFNIEAPLSLSEYFPLFSGGLRPNIVPSELRGYSLQLILLQSDINAVAIINHASLPKTSNAPQTGNAPQTASVVLDIDLFREGISWNPQDDAGLWSELEQLRERKNDLFRACITEQAEDSLEPIAQ